MLCSLSIVIIFSVAQEFLLVFFLTTKMFKKYGASYLVKTNIQL